MMWCELAPQNLCGGTEKRHTNLILDNQSLDQDLNAGKGKMVKQALLQVWTGPEGFQELETPRFHDNRHMKVVRL
jgi:hypothetical protein